MLYIQMYYQMDFVQSQSRIIYTTKKYIAASTFSKF